MSIIQRSEAGTLTTRNRYTYEGLETRGDRQLEKFRLHGSLSFTPRARFPGIMVLKSRSIEGHVYFDREAGQWIETTRRLEMEQEFNERSGDTRRGQLFQQRCGWVNAMTRGRNSCQ